MSQIEHRPRENKLTMKFLSLLYQISLSVIRSNKYKVGYIDQLQLRDVLCKIVSKKCKSTVMKNKKQHIKVTFLTHQNNTNFQS